MIQPSSMARIKAASTTRSSLSGRDLYKPGDLVDFFRKGATKEESGWRGPTEVVENRPSEGQVIIKINGRDLPSRYQDTRHTLLVFSPTSLACAVT